MSKLIVHSIFASLQGEGPFSGEPAVFIRLGGCNMVPPCSFCDTDYDSVSTEWDQMALADHVFGIIETKYPNINLVVITGGEPFLQNFDELVSWLSCRKGLKIQIETNGTIDPPFGFPLSLATIVVSPKQGASVKIRRMDALKILVQEGDEVEPGNIVDTYLQPLDIKDPVQNKKNMDWCVKLCMETGYKLSLQLHKILSIP